MKCSCISDVKNFCYAYHWKNKRNNSAYVFGDHAPPHFHATNNEKEGLFKIDDLEMLRGDLNTKDQKKVKGWANPRKGKLKKMWDSQDIHNID